MRFILFLTTLLFLFSCEVINTEEDIPSTITIESIEVDGNHTSKITDAWIYIDNEFQGVFPLPANFPVLKTGQQKLLLKQVSRKMVFLLVVKTILTSLLMKLTQNSLKIKTLLLVQQ